MDTKNITTGGNNMKTSPLANKLKQLRRGSDLSTTSLADQLDISSAHIHYIENNKRGLSDELLKKYADFFSVSFEELKDLQRSSVTTMPSNKNNDQDNNDTDLDEYISLLLSIEKPLMLKFLQDSKEQLQQMFYTMLTPYNLNDIKKTLTNIRDSWYLAAATGFDEAELIGNLDSPEQEIYFKLVVKKQYCSVELPYDNYRKVDYFSKWLTEPDANITLHKKIPHLVDNQKVKVYHWFSPEFSQRDQFNFLRESYSDISQLYVQSSQLNLLVKHHLSSKEDPQHDIA